jgi:hypothetical protein
VPASLEDRIPVCQSTGTAPSPAVPSLLKAPRRGVFSAGDEDVGIAQRRFAASAGSRRPALPLWAGRPAWPDRRDLDQVPASLVDLPVRPTHGPSCAQAAYVGASRTDWWTTSSLWPVTESSRSPPARSRHRAALRAALRSSAIGDRPRALVDPPRAGADGGRDPAALVHETASGVKCQFGIRGRPSRLRRRSMRISSPRSSLTRAGLGGQCPPGVLDRPRVREDARTH